MAMRRLLAGLAWVGGGALALLLLMAAALMLIGNTALGQRWMAGATRALTGGRVQLQGLSGRFPDNLRVQQLLISDPQGAWLRASDVHLDWSPMALLQDRMRIRLIDADQASVLRRPAYGGRPARQTPVRGGFSLPMGIQIDQLRLSRLRLGADLAGSEVALRLQGAVSYRSLERASLQLSVQRLDAVPATYLVSADLLPRHLALQMDLEEEANGPLANLIELPGMGALSVHLLMEGPRSAVKTRLDAHAGPLTASANGTLDLPGRAAQLTLSLQGDAMTLRPGLSWRALSLHAQADGALTAPSTSAHLKLSGLRYQSVTFDDLTADLQGVGQGLSLQAQLAGLVLPAPLGDLMRRSPLALKGQMSLAGANAGDLDLSVVHPLLQAQAQTRLDLSGRGRQSAPVSFTASVPNLAPWATLAKLSLTGRGTLQGSLTQQRSGRELSVAAMLAVSGGAKPWAALLAGRSTLDTQLTLDSGSVQLSRFALSAPRLALSASGEDRQGVLDLRWQLNRADLAALDSSTAGELSAQGRVQGSLPRLTLSASAQARVRLHQASGALRATLQAQGLPESATGRMSLSGTLDGAPVALQANLQSVPAGGYAVQIARGSWKSALVAGTLRIDGDIRAPSGRLTLSAPRLADLDPLLGTTLSGQLSAQLALQGRGTRSRAQLNLSGRDVALGSIRLRSLSVDGTIDEPLSAPRAALRLSAQGTLGGVEGSLSGSASGVPARLMLTTHAAIGGGVQIATQLDAQAIWLGTHRQLELTSLDAHYREQMLRLLSPAMLSFDGGFAVNQLRLGLPPAIVQVSGQITPKLALRATVRRLSPAALGIFLPEFRGLQPRGTARADLVLQGSLADPSGTLNFTATGLHSAGDGVHGLPDASLTLTAVLAAHSATVQLALEAGAQMQLHADGRLPLDRTHALAMQLQGNLDLAFANPVLEASGQRALGQMAVQADVAGTWASPQVHGQLTLSKGELQDFARGLQLSGVNAALTATGPELTLTHLSAQAGSGTITASGKIDMGAAGMPVELSVDAHHAQPVRSDLLTADVDMALKLSGQLLGQLSATGNVHVNKATINIPNAMPPAVAVLHVVRPGQQAAPPPAPKPLFATLDLTINAPTGIFVRGRGLSAQVGGTLHVMGNSTTPAVTGGFDLLNGTIDIAGTSINFTNGRVSFTGSGLRNRIDPTLNLVAASYSGSYAVTLTVTGYADAPVISFSSMPALPQDEILARLLFGESVAQLSPLQIAGIGAALVTLSGAGGGGFNPINKVQQALGLNRLVISSTSSNPGATASSAGGTAAQGNSGATIEAGRYISNRVYVGARQSTAGTTQAQVQIDLTRNWKLQTTLSTGGGPVQGVVTPQNDPGSSIGMRYQFEY